MVLRLKLMGKPTTKRNLSFGQNQGIAWSSDSNLWGNQLLKENSRLLRPMGRLFTKVGLSPRYNEDPDLSSESQL